MLRNPLSQRSLRFTALCSLVMVASLAAGCGEGDLDSNSLDSRIEHALQRYAELVQMGRNGLETAFVEEPLRGTLLERFEADVANFEAAWQPAARQPELARYQGPSSRGWRDRGRSGMLAP